MPFRMVHLFFDETVFIYEVSLTKLKKIYARELTYYQAEGSN